MTRPAFIRKLIDRCTIRRRVLDHVTNGAFATDTGWTKGAEWTIASGVAMFLSTASGTSLTQDVGAVAGERYRVSFDMTIEAGAPTITVLLGSATVVAVTTAGSYEKEVVATSAGDLTFTGTGLATASATLNNVEVFRIGDSGQKVGVETDVATDVRCRFQPDSGREIFVDTQAVVVDGVLFMGIEDIEETDDIIMTSRGGVAITEFTLDPEVIRLQEDARRIHHYEIDVRRVK